MFSLQSYTPEQIVFNAFELLEKEIVKAKYKSSINQKKQSKKHFLTAIAYIGIIYSVTLN